MPAKKTTTPKPIEKPVAVAEVKAPVKKTRTKADPAISNLRKQYKNLQKENEVLKGKLEEAGKIIDSVKTENNALRTAVDRMSTKYSKITNYIESSLNVFHRSVLMAFEEDKE